MHHEVRLVGHEHRARAAAGAAAARRHTRHGAEAVGVQHLRGDFIEHSPVGAWHVADARGALACIGVLQRGARHAPDFGRTALVPEASSEDASRRGRGPSSSAAAAAAATATAAADADSGAGAGASAVAAAAEEKEKEKDVAAMRGER